MPPSPQIRRKRGPGPLCSDCLQIQGFPQPPLSSDNLLEWLTEPRETSWLRVDCEAHDSQRQRPGARAVCAGRAREDLCAPESTTVSTGVCSDRKLPGPRCSGGFMERSLQRHDRLCHRPGGWTQSAAPSLPDRWGWDRGTNLLITWLVFLATSPVLQESPHPHGPRVVGGAPGE